MKQTTRRQFLQYSGAMCAITPLSPAAFFSEFRTSGFSSRLALDPRRPQFHLLPAHNWMNDPNGPIHFAGKYHMFFQYNPEAAVWGNMSWNHAISDDMLHWKLYPVAFTMTPGGPDAAGCFSGSTILIEHEGKPRVCAIYTGVVNDKVHETVRNEGLRESQCLAWSEDPLLLHWTKLPRPVILTAPRGRPIVGFRDPSVWKEGGDYFMTIGAGIAKVGGCVLLYRSKDLKEWEYIHPLISGAWSREYTPNPVGDGEMWECPDFFPLDGGYILIYSSMKNVVWQSGVLDKAAMKFQPKKSGVLDLDCFYAPKTQLDAQGRRILWGWIPERRSKAEMIEAGWAGMMSLPRVLSLDSDGSLRMQVLPETAMLRGESLESSDSAMTLENATAEILCAGKKRADMALSVMLGSTELLGIQYSAEKHAWLVDGQNTSLQPSDLPKAHIFVDGSVIEMILSERVGCTKRFYYPGSAAPRIAVRASGTESTLKAWTITPISNNRLTTISTSS